MAPHYSHRGHQERQGSAADRNAVPANPAGAQVCQHTFLTAWPDSPKRLACLLPEAKRHERWRYLPRQLPVLQQRMKALEDRAAQDRAAAQGIMKSLDWPKPQHFDDAFEAAANHEP